MRGEKGRKGIKTAGMVLSTYNEGNIDCGDVQVRVIPHGETLIKSVGNVEVVCQLSLILVPGEVPLDTMLAVGKETHAHAECIITPLCTHYAHIASFPGLPHFCSSVYTEAEECKKTGKAWEWCPRTNIFEHSNDSQDPRRSRD